MKINRRELFFASPGRGTIIWGNAFYTRAKGLAKMCHWRIQTRSDVTDVMQRSFSEDNGRTWSPLESIPLIVRTPEGTIERFPGLGFADPVEDRLLTLISECRLPEGRHPNDVRESHTRAFLSYQVSLDGGRTAAIDEQIIQDGPYTPDHPFEGIWQGKNGLAPTGTVLRTRSGRLLMPVMFVPLGPDGSQLNPGGGYTFEYAAVLIAAWQPDHRLRWELSAPITIDPGRSTRGIFEGDVAELSDGRILHVLRGSNDVKPELPGYKWYTISSDGGYTWRPVEPWTYADGTPFYSPSSCGQFVRHSNGHLYWFGNITPENPKGNHPRHPLVAGRVDLETGLLIKDSVTTILDRQPNEHPLMQLSNFFI